MGRAQSTMGVTPRLSVIDVRFCKPFAIGGLTKPPLLSEKARPNARSAPSDPTAA